LANQKGVDIHELDKDEAEDEQDALDRRQANLVISDLIITALFIAFILYYRIRSILIIRSNFNTNIILSDFSLRVNGIPKDKDLRDDDIYKHFSKFGKVHEASLTRINYDILDLYKKRADLLKQLRIQQAIDKAKKKTVASKKTQKLAK
jgi:hypothetical protein